MTKLKKGLITISLLLSSVANAEQIANSAFMAIQTRYHNSKQNATNDYLEIRLACAGEIFREWVDGYDIVVRTNSLNTNLIPQYFDIKESVRLHRLDIQNIYSIIREKMITEIRSSITRRRAVRAIPMFPNMNIENYDLPAMEANISLCNDRDFLNEIALAAPLTAGYEEEITSEGRLDIADTDDDFDDIFGDEEEPAQRETVEKTQSVSDWLYEIYIR